MQIHKYLFAVMIFLLICVYAIAANTLYQSRLQHVHEAQQATKNLAQSFALNVEGVINKIDISLFSVATEVKRQMNTGGIDKKLLQSFLSEQKERLNEFEDLWVSDEKGDLNWGTNVPPTKPVNISDREYFQRLKNNPSLRMVISKPLMGRITKAWSVLIAQRVNKVDGSFGGAVLGSLRVVDYFNSVFSGIEVGKEGILQVRDGFLLVARYPNPSNLDQLIGKPGVSDKTIEMTKISPNLATYIAVSSVDHKEKFISYKKVGSTSWYIVAALGITEQLAPWYRELRNTILILLLFTAIELFLARILYLRAKELVITRETERRNLELEMEVKLRQKTEEELKRNSERLEVMVKERTAKLENANAELESFSYSVSHDLRAPLRGIDGWSMALKEDYSNVLDETGKSYLDRVRSETKRMEILIDDLLKLSKISRSDISFNKVNLSALVEIVSKRMIEDNPKRKINFIIQPGIEAFVDQHFIEIALTNLLSNACKFTSKIESATIEFGVVKKDDENVYFIRDNGVGFNMNLADKLFVVFQRMHRQTEYPGTGIGLATVKRIINLHNGRIWAESSVNNGATFYFTLKVSADEEL
jgi:signal transduction histidine kinase